MFSLASLAFILFFSHTHYLYLPLLTYVFSLSLPLSLSLPPSLPPYYSQLCINGHVEHSQQGIDALPDMLCGHLSLDPAIIADVSISRHNFHDD